MADEPKPQFSDDPELERAKAWWHEHGRAIVAGVVVGLIAVVGYNFWESYQQSQAEKASSLYEELREVIASHEADAADDEADDEASDEASDEATDDTTDDASKKDDKTAEAEKLKELGESIETIADNLMFNYGSTPYAVHAAFALAKFLVDNGDLEKAEDTLHWVRTNAEDESLLHIARLRLATVLLARGDTNTALVVLNVSETAGFAPRYSELIGDAYHQRGDNTNARAAYQNALASLRRDSIERALVKLKLDNLER